MRRHVHVRSLLLLFIRLATTFVTTSSYQHSRPVTQRRLIASVIFATWRHRRRSPSRRRRRRRRVLAPPSSQPTWVGHYTSVKMKSLCVYLSPETRGDSAPLAVKTRLHCAVIASNNLRSSHSSWLQHVSDVTTFRHYRNTSRNICGYSLFSPLSAIAGSGWLHNRAAVPLAQHAHANQLLLARL